MVRQCQLIRFLGFADAEHLRAAFGADTLGRRFAILHLNGLGIFHFPLGPAFHAISFHQCTSYVFEFSIDDYLKLVKWGGQS
jgi:hypothetical protein